MKGDNENLERTFNYYYETKALEDRIQKLFMVWLIRLEEDVEMADNFVDNLYGLYIGCDNTTDIVDFTNRLDDYLYETGQSITNFCLEGFKDYLFDEN